MMVKERDPRTPILEMRGISKAFPGVRALDDVSLAVQAGEVHVLLGQNGAGKSTLIKVLCGAHHPDRGRVPRSTAGRCASQSPADARRLGIAVIFQEFSLVPYLDVAQNIFLGREPRGRIPGIDRPPAHARRGAASARRARPRPRHAHARRTSSAWRSSRWSRSPRRCRRTRASWSWTSRRRRCPSREIERLFDRHPHAQAGRRGDRLHLAPAAGDLRDRRSDHRAARRPATSRRCAPSETTRRRAGAPDGRPRR